MESYRHYVYKTTNLTNGYVYVGIHSAPCSFGEDNYLGSGTYLTRAINKYGKENFICEELCEVDSRQDAEDIEYLIVDEEFVNRKDTYNIIGGGVRGRLGIPPHTRQATLISPDGEEVLVDNIAKFCRENNMLHSCILELERGLISHHRGWTVPNSTFVRKTSYNRQADKKFYHFVNDDGREVKGKFYKKELEPLLGISRKSFDRILFGDKKRVRGWVAKVKYKPSLKYKKNIHHQFVFKNMDGRSISGVFNFRELSQILKLDIRTIKKLCKREGLISKGWYCESFISA